MRVLMVLDGLDIGGTETHVLALTTQLVAIGVSVVVIARDGKLHNEFAEIGCPVYTVDFSWSCFPFTQHKMRLENQIKAIIKKEIINIIHVHHPPSGYRCIIIARKLYIPCVFTIHGKYYQDVIPVLNKCTEIISVSYPVFNYLNNFNVSSSLIPNGIDIHEFSPKQSDDFREIFGIPPKSLVVMYSSRMTWGKSVMCKTLLMACRDLYVDSNIDFNVIVIGDGNRFKEIKELVAQIHDETKKKFIHLLGERLSIKRFYEVSDCVVGSGCVALEAMACAKPVIAAGNHGYFGVLEPEIYEKAWEYYFGDHMSENCNQRLNLAEDIKKLLESPEKRKVLGEKGREWVEAFFNIEIIVQDIINIYKLAHKKKD